MSESWQWFFAIIGMVAFLMAVQPVTQVILGRAKPVFGFRVANMNKNETLICDIWNNPIRSWFLKALAIRRNQIENISAQFEIFSGDRDDMIKIGNTVIPVVFKRQENITEQINLSASITPISFPIVTFNEDISPNAFIVDSPVQTRCLSPQNDYSVKVTIAYEDKTKSALQKFTIISSLPHIRLHGRR
jgi:hypothetical protein